MSRRSPSRPVPLDYSLPFGVFVVRRDGRPYRRADAVATFKRAENAARYCRAEHADAIGEGRTPRDLVSLAMVDCRGAVPSADPRAASGARYATTLAKVEDIDLPDFGRCSACRRDRPTHAPATAYYGERTCIYCAAASPEGFRYRFEVEQDDATTEGGRGTFAPIDPETMTAANADAMTADEVRSLFSHAEWHGAAFIGGGAAATFELRRVDYRDCAEYREAKEADEAYSAALARHGLDRWKTPRREYPADVEAALVRKAEADERARVAIISANGGTP